MATSLSVRTLPLLACAALLGACDEGAGAPDALLARSSSHLEPQVELIRDINTQSFNGFVDPGTYVALGDSLLFAHFRGTDGVELWRSDGSAAGTVLVKDIATAQVLGGSYPRELTVLGSRVVFMARDEAGDELWVTDGTTAGTQLLKDLYVGPESGAPAELTVIGSTLYFSARDATGRYLWKSDGTAAGTVRVSSTGVDLILSII